MKILDGYEPKQTVAIGQNGTIYDGALLDNIALLSIRTSKFGKYAVAEKESAEKSNETPVTKSPKPLLLRADADRNR